jgi:hypothetical protein
LAMLRRRAFVTAARAAASASGRAQRARWQPSSRSKRGTGVRANDRASSRAQRPRRPADLVCFLPASVVPLGKDGKTSRRPCAVTSWPPRRRSSTGPHRSGRDRVRP